MSSPLVKKGHVSDCQKKISFVQIMHLKLTFLFPDNIKSYISSQSVARQYFFLFEISSKDIGISKLKITVNVIARFIVCIGVSLPLPLTPSFLPTPAHPLKLANCPSPPPFQAIPSYILVFRDLALSPYKLDSQSHLL